MKIIIMPVAGTGTRLFPQTHTKPKSMFYLAGKPIIGHILNRMKDVDYNNIITIVPHLINQTISYLYENYFNFFHITYVDHDEQLELGHSIYVAREDVGDSPVMIALGSSDKFTFIEHDITKSLYFGAKIGYMFHMASPVDYLELPIQTLKVGAFGAHNMLGLAKEHNARIRLASTSEVYGDPLVNPQPESYWGNVNPIGPRGVYDEAKRYAEAITMAYHRYHGVDTRIVRPTEMTILEFANAVLDTTDSKSKLTFKDLLVDDSNFRKPDISRAKEILGWMPKVGLGGCCEISQRKKVKSLWE